MLIAAISVLAAAQTWQYEVPPAPPVPPAAAVAPASPTPPASPPPTWRDLVGPLARSQSMTSEELSEFVSAASAFLDANPGERAPNLARLVRALGPNAPLLGDAVMEELRRPAMGASDASTLRDLGLAASEDVGLATRALVEAKAGRAAPDSPGISSMVRGLLDPAFPFDQFPHACNFVDLLEERLPEWGKDAATDARLVRVLSSCPSEDLGFVPRGLSDARPEVRSAALYAWEAASRSGKPAAVQDPEAVAAAIEAMLAAHGLPPADGGPGTRTPAQVVVSALLPLDRVDYALAALGNSGRKADMLAVTLAERAARAPKGSRSFRDLVR